MHQSTTPPLSQTIWPRWASRQFLSLPIVHTLLPVTFAHPLSSEAVVMRQLRRWKILCRRPLTRSHKRISMGPSRSWWYGTTSALQSEEITLKGTRVSWVYYQEKCPYEKSLETYRMPLVVLSCNYLANMVETVFKSIDEITLKVKKYSFDIPCNILVDSEKISFHNLITWLSLV